ncbi:MAG: hypothetical protein COA67_11200 [Lutibacter sp.]|nr:MAG: hypothetical protein COA67_11200 [Lutibacter sp.]
MKLVYCIGYLGKPGGTEKVLANKANYMVDKLGYEVEILIADQKNHSLYYDFNPKIKIHDMKISKINNRKTIPVVTFIKNIFKLREIYSKKLNEINPDVILVLERGYHDFVIPYINKKIPKIREFHFSLGAVDSKVKILSFIQKVKYKIIYSFIYKQFPLYDKVVLLTEKDENEPFYNNVKTTVIPNMIENFPEDISELNSQKVISIGSMEDDRKGFLKQIEIWRKISINHPKWILNIYGEGKQRKKYIDVVKQNKLETKIIFHGKSTEIPVKLNESSIFIFTSEAEGLPMVLIEALTNGLPCVSYDCPTGPSDIISNEEDGYIININDEKMFIEKLELLMNNIELRRKLGDNARKNSIRFLPENVMPLWQKLFEELISINLK